LTEKAERMKEETYKDFTVAHGLKVLPFVITSNGKYGKVAKDIIKFMKEICKRNKIMYPKTQLEERISLLLETSRYQMEEIFYKEMERLTAQGELRSAKKAHITLPKLPDDFNMNPSSSYWKTQLFFASRTLNGKDPVNLQSKVEEQKQKQKYIYEPNIIPPPDPPDTTENSTDNDDENDIFVKNYQFNSKNNSIHPNNTKLMNENNKELNDNNNKDINNNNNKNKNMKEANNYENEEEIDLN